MLKYFVALISLIAAGAFHSFGSRVQRPLVKSSLSMYAVRIVNNKKNTDFTIGIPPGAIILDYAETQGYSIPYSCRAGSCSSCIGIMKSGEVDQTGQIFLSDQQVEDGFVLTCVATATSDCEIEVDVEDMFYNMNPDMVEE